MLMNCLSGSVVGIDCHEGVLALARAASPPGIQWRRADAAALPLPSATFDAALYQQRRQVFTDPMGALREMHRVLVAGGRAGLSVFSEASRYHRALADALALSPFSLCSAGALCELMARAGFGAIEVSRQVLTRRVQPSQDWLLRDASGTPHGSALAALDAEARARLVRAIAAQLKDLWEGDAFAVPTPIHFVFARKPNPKDRP